MVPIFYAEHDDGIGFTPDEYVDIIEEMETKEQMLKCHESQLKWLLEHDGIDIVGSQRTRAAFCGGQCKVKYAEVFKQLHASGRMRTYRVLP